MVTIARDFKRYVGAQIGIYNPSGERVGRVGRLRNTEFIFVGVAGMGGDELAARMGLTDVSAAHGGAALAQSA